MVDRNFLYTNMMYGFGTQHLAETRGTSIPSTNPREGRRGHWARDQKAMVALQPSPSQAGQPRMRGLTSLGLCFLL